MRLSEGISLGPYRILQALGAGGMGVVYRARDTRLDRDVAIKVLPAHLSSDPQRRQRMEREARAISRLNHPNICALYDLGIQDGTVFLVMEYLEGETLSARLMRGSLRLAEALRFSIEIAGALAHAHQQGIVHRDLTPRNVMLTRSGAKLLDFGLAKLEMADSTPDNLLAPTGALAIAPLSQEGTLVGTLQYMAPEQLGGAPGSARSDVHAFGLLVYEMVTGQKAFPLNNPNRLAAAILNDTPPLISTFQPAVPRCLDQLVAKCLAKDPQERWQNCQDMASALHWIADGSFQHCKPVHPAKRRFRFERLAWVGLALALAAVSVLLYFWHLPPETVTGRFLILPPADTAFVTGGGLSPDGRQIAFCAAAPSGRSMLWVRPLDSTQSRALPGTEHAYSPFWSPDSRFVGFFAQGKLKTIEVAGGNIVTLADAREGRGGTWSKNGIILYVPGTDDTIYRISSEGGKPTPVMALDTPHHGTHRWPFFLPDDRHFLFVARGASENTQAAYLGSIDSAEERRLTSTGSKVAYIEPGFLLFVREGKLLALPFDATRLNITGEPSVVADQVEHGSGRGEASFSAYGTSILAYRTSTTTLTQLVWVDRTGQQVKVVTPPGEYRSPALAPDESSIVAEIRDPQTRTYNISRILLPDRAISQITFDASDETNALWSPDGRKIVFSSNKKGPRDILRRTLISAGGDEVIIESASHKNPDQWTFDGRFIVFTTSGPETRNDLWVLPLAGDEKPRPYLQTPANDVQGQLSPDGRWMAYASDESGNWEVYVQSFPTPGARYQISVAGGAQPRWRRDGRELFYLAADKRLMVLQIRPESPTFVASAPRPLFQTRASGLTNARNHYEVSRDGQSFLLNNQIEEVPPSPITVVYNWLTAGK